MSKRTVRDFNFEGELWPIVDSWAQETGYNLKESNGAKRLYQRGHGVLVAPMMLEIAQTGKDVHFEAWIRVSLMVRLFALFLLPSQMGIESGGFQGVVPRKMARAAVNKLLERIDQAAIQ
ncbi:MAG: hypothetical protein V3R87_00780 [Dehalococcoidia bacterium]